MIITKMNTNDNHKQKKNRSKAAAAAVLLLAAAVISACLFSSCSSGKHCTLTINASYSGFDIAGNDLGSGGYEESFTVYNGTALTASEGGGSHMKIQDKKDEYTWIEILSIDENGVSYRLRKHINDEGSVIQAGYGSETETVDTIVHDGQCTYRKMKFSDYAE